MIEKIYTAKEVKDILHIKDAQYYRYIKSGILKSSVTKAGTRYFTESQIKEFLNMEEKHEN